YNTGNEGWAYNDNVNSPLIKEWLSGNPVNGEDMLRHDKWLCMMWPRLKLLHELLSERGSIWITRGAIGPGALTRAEENARLSIERTNAALGIGTGHIENPAR